MIKKIRMNENENNSYVDMSFYPYDLQVSIKADYRQLAQDIKQMTQELIDEFGYNAEIIYCKAFDAGNGYVELSMAASEYNRTLTAAFNFIYSYPNQVRLYCGTLGKRSFDEEAQTMKSVKEFLETCLNNLTYVRK